MRACAVASIQHCSDPRTLSSMWQRDRRCAWDLISAVADDLPTRSDPAAGPPPTEDLLAVAYEAGLWQLLELFFLSSDTPEGFFAEVGRVNSNGTVAVTAAVAAAAAVTVTAAVSSSSSSRGSSSGSGGSNSIWQQPYVGGSSMFGLQAMCYTTQLSGPLCVVLLSCTLSSLPRHPTNLVTLIGAAYRPRNLHNLPISAPL
jgi:hypothetical protein